MKRGVTDGWPRGVRPPIAIAVVVVLPVLLLVVSVQVGLSGLGTRHLDAPGSSFDAAAAQGHDVGAITPLSASYVDRLLGRGSAGSASDPTSAGSTTNAGDALASADGPSGVRPTSLAPRSNDDFDHAFAVPTMPFTAATDTSGATREPRESTDCSAVVGTVWFRLRLPISAPITVSTFGSSYPAITGVFAATDTDGLQRVACVRTIGDFSARANTTYFFQVSGTGGSLLFHLVEAQSASHLLVGSVANDGRQPITGNDGETITADGRYLVFNSGDESLAGGIAGETHTALADVGIVRGQDCTTPGDVHPDYAPDEPTHTDVRPDCQVIYERDLATGRNVKVGFGYQPVVSADGRYIAYSGSAAQRDIQVYMYDVRTHHRWLVSHRWGDRRAEGSYYGATGMSWHPVMTPDGRYVGFASSAEDLVRHDDNGTVDGFVWDRVTGHIRRITTSSAGAEQDYGGTRDGTEIGVVQCLSPDGRYAVFSSPATNLTGKDRNRIPDVFRKDLRTGQLVRISVGIGGRSADGMSPAPGHLSGHCMSEHGRYVLFPSYADNLVRGDTNNSLDFFVRDVARGTTVRVNVSSTGAQAQNDYGQCLYGLADATPEHVSCSQTDFSCSITPSGRYVGFTSIADNLVADDTNGFADVFRHDMLTGETVRVSSPPADNLAAQAAGASEQAEGGDSVGGDLSGNGRTVVFHSFASNLVVGDTNGAADAFVARFPPLRLPLGALLGSWPARLTGIGRGEPTGGDLAVGGQSPGGTHAPSAARATGDTAGMRSSNPLDVLGLTVPAADGAKGDGKGSSTDPLLLLLVAVPVAVVIAAWTAARRRSV